MFKEFFRYDFSSRIRQPMIYIFFVVCFALVMTANLNDNVTISGGVGGETFINSPLAVLYLTAFMNLLGSFMTVALTNPAALRDFDNKFDQILFTAPIRKSGYFFGRFFSSFLLAVIPMLAVLMGVFVSSLFADAEKTGPFILSSYLMAFFVFALPNTLLSASVFFPLAAKTRSGAIAFAGAIVLLIGYLVSTNILSSLENEWLATIFDPFALGVISLETKYWTLEEQNTLVFPVTLNLILNRVLWLSVSAGIIFLSFKQFSFEPKTRKGKKSKEAAKSPKMSSHLLQNYKSLPLAKRTYGLKLQLQQLGVQFRLELGVLLRSPAFLVLLLFGTFNTSGSIYYADAYFGTGNLPVSYVMTDAVKNSISLVVIIIIGFYSGQLVWAERKAKMNEFLDASPQASWIPLFSKFSVLTSAVAVLMTVNIVFAMLMQLYKGYTNLEPEVYFVELILLELPYFMLVIALALAVHTFVNHQYLGFFIFLVLVIFQLFGWSALEINSNLLTFGGKPNHVYSDMSRWMPYAEGLFGYTVYWSLVGILILIVSSLFWVRGKGFTFGQRVASAKQRFHGRPAASLLMTVLLLGGTGSLLYYKSEVLNENLSVEERISRMVSYEETYKKFEGTPHPRIISADYKIDLYPEKRGMEAEAKLWVKNKHEEPLSDLHFSLPSLFTLQIEVPNAENTLKDEELRFQTFKLQQPLAPGDSMQITVKASYEAKGIENQLALNNLTQNGIFINNTAFMPVMGYDPSRELRDKEEREERGLKEREEMLEPVHVHDCGKKCTNSFISQEADWISLSTVISTSADQTAIAPGALTKKWEENGRNYYAYAPDKPVLNFYAFLSAKYEIKREKWEGIDLEVYYHPTHDHNIDKMISSMKNSLGYYSKTFAPYPHSQARIIEFPRFSSFAQAFPGTMPYSESIGFLADLKDPEDIDFVTYVVAHEMGHQWWAHQLIGADLKGVQMLSETFAQYSALMVMEHTYGRDVMGKFLKHEADTYLRSRRRLKEEPTLMHVESESSIYYNKGSLVMYALREYLGEDSVNVALRRFMDKYAYISYPTTVDFLKELEAVTPDSLNYLVDDFFRKVTLYDNAIEEANYRPVADGKYEVTLKLRTRKLYADSKGKETEQAISDFIEIGIYGEKEEGKPLGKKLHSEFKKFNSNENTLTFITEEKPEQAGIDPRSLLTDRFTEDNVKDVDLAE